MNGNTRMKNFVGKLIDNLIHYKALGIAILIGSVLLGGVIVALGPNAEPQARSEKAWPVSTLVATKASLRPTLVAYGKVESRQISNLKTSITAPVAAVLRPEGSWVNAGELLVQLDAEELMLAQIVADAESKRRVARLESARSDFELARKITQHHEELKAIAESKLERHLDLYQNKMVSNAILDEARREANERSITLERHLADLRTFPNVISEREASVAEGNAMVKRARLDVEQTRIVAPFSGRVIATYVSAGDRVLPGTAIVQVADFSELEVRSAIPAAVGHRLRQQVASGMLVTAQGEVDGKIIEFTLNRLSGDVKRGQSGLDAFFKTEIDDELDIGRVVNLSITLPAEPSVIALPLQSIYENNRIYKVVDRRLKGIEVAQVGDYLDASGKHQVLIRSEEIVEGDVLITTQLPRAISGLLVDPVDPVDVQDFENALAVDAGSMPVLQDSSK